MVTGQSPTTTAGEVKSGWSHTRLHSLKWRQETLYFSKKFRIHTQQNGGREQGQSLQNAVSYMHLSYDVAVIQWISLCHKIV